MSERASRGSKIPAAARLEDLPTVLDATQAMAILQVSRSTLRRYTKEGLIRRLRYAQRHLYYKAEVERFLRDQTGAKTEEAAS